VAVGVAVGKGDGVEVAVGVALGEGVKVGVAVWVAVGDAVAVGGGVGEFGRVVGDEAMAAGVFDGAESARHPES
jgi:hypothetical protein